MDFLRKGDLVEYSYHFSKDVIDIRRDIVKAVIKDRSSDTDGVFIVDAELVVGGIFSFDFPNFRILKVWREDSKDEYSIIYKAKGV